MNVPEHTKELIRTLIEEVLEQDYREARKSIKCALDKEDPTRMYITFRVRAVWIGSPVVAQVA